MHNTILLNDYSEVQIVKKINKIQGDVIQLLYCLENSIPHGVTTMFTEVVYGPNRNRYQYEEFD